MKNCWKCHQNFNDQDLRAQGVLGECRECFDARKQAQVLKQYVAECPEYPSTYRNPESEDPFNLATLGSTIAQYRELLNKAPNQFKPIRINTWSDWEQHFGKYYAKTVQNQLESEGLEVDIVTATREGSIMRFDIMLRAPTISKFMVTI